MRVLLHALSGVAAIVLIDAFIEEQLCSARGVSRPASSGSLRHEAPLAGVSLALLASVALAGSAALVPLSLLARLLALLQRIRLGFGAPPPPAPSPAPALGRMPEELRALGAAAPSPTWQAVVRIIGIVAAAAAAAGFLFFLVRPLLARGTRKAARRLHPVRLLAQRVAGLLLFLRRLPGALSRWARGPGRILAMIPRSILAAVRESSGDVPGGRRKERAARAARGRALREFLRLARWGERKGAPFSGVEGPAEYAERLGRCAPEKGAALAEAARLFEELAYSPAPRERGERELARMVGGIVR